MAAPVRWAHPRGDLAWAARIGITGHSDLTPPSLAVVRDVLRAELRAQAGAAWVGVSTGDVVAAARRRGQPRTVLWPPAPPAPPSTPARCGSRPAMTTGRR